MSAVKTIGIIGGGQLGLMIIEQAHLLGARTICLDPAEDAPAFKISDERIVGRFDDPAALEELCRRSDVVTYEFENVPGNLLVALEQKYNIKQGFRPLFDSQDRLREKSNACDHGLKTPAFMAVDDEESLHRAIARIGYPCVLKTRTLGYDGHGQAVLRGEADLAKARELLAVPCILEEFVPFDFEASVVLVSDGERVICFAHMPLMPPDGQFTLWNNGQIAALLQRYPCVRAFLAGHHHKGGAHRFGSVLHFIFQGMIEGPDNHYAIVEVYPDKLVIRGYGAQRDEILRWL